MAGRPGGVPEIEYRLIGAYGENVCRQEHLHAKMVMQEKRKFCFGQVPPSGSNRQAARST